MSAILSAEDLQPVADLIERVQNVQRAIRDLHETRDEVGAPDVFNVSITCRDHLRDYPVANTHQLSYWIVLQGLAAMERELLKQLQQREITVESVLPIKEIA